LPVRGRKMKVTIITGFFTKRDMNINACHGIFG
jgi:hypothetical protein